MIWDTLADVQRCTRLEFTPAMADRHCFVQLPSGRWCRTYGVPEGATKIRGRTYRITT